MKSKNRYLIMSLVLIILILIISGSLYLVSNYEKTSPNLFVESIIDGDTFEMSDGMIIRLLCVDTPEKKEEGYDDATRFLAGLILGKEVRLVEPETMSKTDKYNRSLMFVYVNSPEKEIFVNKEILDFGFGKYYPYEDVEKECEMLRN